MGDASVAVAAISAGAALLGATLSQVSAAFQDSRRARHERQEQYDDSLRAACVDLLRAVGDLRDRVADNYFYPGGAEMGDRLAQMRHCLTTAKVQAVSVALLAPRALAQPARELTEAAERLTAKTVQATDRMLRAANQAPDFTELDARVLAFSEHAEAYARMKGTAIRGRGRGRRAVAPPRDDAGTAVDP
ncbi:MAG TPA: hypothetical protein VN969_01960 [Streptosporangiaceae bacterium]|jgi:hypothetical protein|nr:hypothetical protein [Streptosporangiaceae bacterium]